MPTRQTTTPRLRLPLLAGIALLLLAACLMFVRSRPAASGADAGKASLPERNPAASSDSGPDGPSVTRKPRPSPETLAADRQMRKFIDNQERDVAKQAATAETEQARLARQKSYLTPGFRLTQKFVDEFHLPAYKVAATQAVLDQRRAELSQWATTNLAYDEKASGTLEKGARIYRLDASRSELEREGMYTRLGQALENAIGAPPVLMDGVSRDAFSEINQAIFQDPGFASMGTQDSVIRFIPGERTVVDDASPGDFIPDDTYTVEITFHDVETGQQTYQSKGGIQLLESIYGDIFQHRGK